MTTVLDLFSGCGGFSLGFEQAGFKVKYAIDFWAGCKETFIVNHPNTEFILADIKELDPHDFKGIDIVIGSPPCQQFSVSNIKRKPELGMVLVDVFKQWIDIIKPKKWIMENVGGVEDYLYSRGFPVIELLNCAYYGVPQTRWRCFAGDYGIPKHTHEEDNLISAEDALKDIKLDYKNFKILNTRDNINYINKSFREIDEPSMTIITGPPKLYRALTPQECARLQSFPDDFKFFGSKSSQYKQIGNAVPPRMAYVLAKSIFNKNPKESEFLLI